MTPELRAALEALYRVRMRSAGSYGADDIEEVRDALFDMIAYADFVKAHDPAHQAPGGEQDESSEADAG